MSRITAAILALALVLTSASMAVARVGMSIHGTLVLCVGTEAVTVLMGPDGQPQEVQHICPDCTIGDLAAAPASEAGAPVSAHMAAISAPRDWVAPTLARRAAAARDPPMHLL